MSEINTASQAQSPNTRIALLDMLRGVALVAMTIFHFSWDLEFFGYARAGMTNELGWKWFARSIAASFLLIAGLSFMLSHINGMRWHSFWRRLAMVAGAAALISLATYFTTPERFVFFGILHQIAAASLIAILFVRLPALLILVAGAAVLALPFFFRSDVFLEPYFWWTGLAPRDPPSNDYVPVFPWTGFMLFGMAAAKFAVRSGLTTKLASVTDGRAQPFRFLSFLGRHSLLYYLIHQPVMMLAVLGFTYVVPPAPIDKSALFITQCVAGCEGEHDKPFCERFCACVRQELETKTIFEEVLDGQRNVTTDPVILETAAVCTGSAQE